ncbi:MAG: PilZ domain-containing protein [Candidatus Aminicenantes bacterium]|nr:PilZ domain-containing protein [Candidatus Aminicenantes bacterium]
MNMNEDRIEKRERARVFFTLEEDITAEVSSHETAAQSIPVTVLSLSSGGVSFLGNRYKLPGIAEGEQLTLTALNFPQPLGTIDNIRVVIIYILDFQHNVRLSFGCEFVDIPGPLAEKIEEFVKFRLKNVHLDL